MRTCLIYAVAWAAFLLFPITQRVADAQVQSSAESPASDSALRGGVHLGSSPGRYDALEGSVNTIFGYGAGAAMTSGKNNSFFGLTAGYLNSSGQRNSFFGDSAGYANDVGYSNSFYGSTAGIRNTSGSNNSFFGALAGYSNTVSTSNSYFGAQAGYANTEGYYNSFFGSAAGHENTTGFGNTFFGNAAGVMNTTGANNIFIGNTVASFSTTESNNTLIGAYSDGAAGITNATAIGYSAKVTKSNSLILGSINGVNGAVSDTNVGIGTTNPDRQLVIEGSQAIARFTRYYGTTDPFTKTFGPAFLFERSRGLQGTPADIISGDSLGKVQFRGRVGGSMAEYGAFSFIATDTSQNGRFAFFDRDITTERMSILNTGNVGIGTSNPTERLQVVGNIKLSGSFLYGAPEVDVPDYVFEPGYDLRSINRLEEFLLSEKHLPNVPGAAEIREKGLNLAEFQMKLLEKIEELTLYTIKQAKQIESRDAEIETLKTENAKRDSRLAAIEELLHR
jgi:hypothetical protein